MVSDPHADVDDLRRHHGIALEPVDAGHPVDALVIAVSHSEYRHFSPLELKAITRGKKPVLIDVKSVQPRAALESVGFTVWRL